MTQRLITDSLITNQEVDALEALVDMHTLSAVIEALALVCSTKADHIRENWQDETTASGWDVLAARLLKVTTGPGY